MRAPPHPHLSPLPSAPASPQAQTLLGHDKAGRNIARSPVYCAPQRLSLLTYPPSPTHYTPQLLPHRLLPRGPPFCLSEMQHSHLLHRTLPQLLGKCDREGCHLWGSPRPYRAPPQLSRGCSRALQPLPLGSYPPHRPWPPLLGTCPSGQYLPTKSPHGEALHKQGNSPALPWILMAQIALHSQTLL